MVLKLVLTVVLLTFLWATAVANYPNEENTVFVDGVGIRVETELPIEEVLPVLEAVLEHLGADVQKSESGILGIVSPYARFLKEHGGMSGFIICGSDALAMVNEDDALVLDVRPVELQADGYIRRSLNIPLYQLLERISEIPKNRTIIVFCANDINAAYATAILTMNQFDVFLMEGGIQDWQEAGGRVSSTCSV